MFRDAALPDLLERVAQIPSTAKGIVVVEGTTDAEYMRLAAERAGRPDLIDDLYITPAGNAKRVVVQAVLLKQQTARPLLALLDNDEPGRTAIKSLCDRFTFQNKKEVMTVIEALPTVKAKKPDFPAEAEDLFPATLLEEFVDEQGEETVLAGKQRRPDGQWHYDLTPTGKDLIIEFLERRLQHRHVSAWIELLTSIRQRMGLS